MSQTIKEIKEILSALTDLDDPKFAELSADSRVGVQKAVKSRQKQLLSAVTEMKRLEQMLFYEQQLNLQGVKLIAGIDEVGRGPLAGPVVAAAVILPENCKIPGLNDSKQVPKSQHEALYEAICQQAVSIGIGQVDEKVIDRINIYEATKVAMLQALSNLSVAPEHVLIDAMRLDMKIPQTKLIHGDAKSASIAAASIVAKVTRDRLMRQLDAQYPGYDFAQNAGYGTKKHLEALQNLGITPIHRRTYEPIKSMLAENH